MQVECPVCATRLGEEQIDHRRGRVECDRCSTVFNLPDEVDEEVNDWDAPVRDGSESPAEERLRDDSRSIPRRITIDEGSDELEILHHWAPDRAYATLGMILLVGTVWIYLFGFSPVEPNPPVVAGGLFMTSYFYWACARIANKTRVRIDRRMLSITHGPLPWWGSRRLPTDEIEQLYCRTRADWWAALRERRGLRPKTVYDVMARLADGREVTLVPGTHGSNQALYIEYAVEKHLGIEDRPVAGEIPG